MRDVVIHMVGEKRPGLDTLRILGSGCFGKCKSAEEIV